jgi:hypothetical protein
MKWLFWGPLLAVLWIHLGVLLTLWARPAWIETARHRWPRVVRGVERGQQIAVMVMLVGVALAVTMLPFAC